VRCSALQCVAVRYSALQRVAVCGGVWRCVEVSCKSIKVSFCAEPHCNTHTATHRNTLQHPAAHCNLLQHIATRASMQSSARRHTAIRTLQITATHRNSLQFTATHSPHCNTSIEASFCAEPHCNTRSAAHCKTLQRTVTHCITLQQEHQSILLRGAFAQEEHVQRRCVCSSVL